MSRRSFNLARLGATHSEIAEFFGCERSTITKRFSPEIDKGHADLKLKLRRMQFRAAERGNVAMLIWLAKAMLGQTDKPREEQEAITVVIDTQHGRTPVEDYWQRLDHSEPVKELPPKLGG
jgi:hypothetical protein